MRLAPTLGAEPGEGVQAGSEATKEKAANRESTRAVTARPDVRLDAAQALANHLRDRPQDARRPADSLAREFGLSTSFVSEFLEGLAEPAQRTDLKPVFNPFIRAFLAARRTFRRLTSDPLRFVTLTTALSITLYLLIDAFWIAEPGTGSKIVRRGGFSVSIEGNNNVFLSFAFTTLLLHLACYFRNGMARYPLFGGLFTWLISAPILMVLVWNRLTDRSTVDTPLVLIGIAIGMLFLSVMYACAGLIASVWGASWRMRQKEKERVRLSRQELLERMFDIQERLQASEGTTQRTDKAWERAADWFNRRPCVFALSMGAAHSLLEVLLFGILLHHFVREGSTPPFIGLLQMAVGALWLMLLIAVGFFSGQTLRAIFNSFLFVVAGFPALLIPVGMYGPEMFSKALSPTSIAVQIGIAIIIATIASAGGRVEERAARERRLTQNDPATLLAELVRLQWQLSPQTSDVCVLVVDAASSAEMKAHADPWAVEYSFREYQSFLHDVVHSEGGSILSTAGDGAVAEFPTPDGAYRAARKIQTHIESFNRKASKLDKPFRLRVGLHMGPVTGCINDVEFSAVIDIAAHVQAAAPVGGIAVTGVVAEKLAGEALAQLAEPVDGQQVYISMSPTLDA